MPIPAYPQILTAADWNNKKGVVAKVFAVPTKLGDTLRKLHESYEEVAWDKLFAAMPASATLLQADQHIMAIKGAVKPQLDRLKQEIDHAKAAAVEVKGVWAKNAIIPKDSKTHLDNLIKAFDAFKTKVDSESVAGLNALVAARTKIAAAKPEELKAHQDILGKGAVVKDKNAPKTEKTLKFKQQPASPGTNQ